MLLKDCLKAAMFEKEAVIVQTRRDSVTQAGHSVRMAFCRTMMTWLYWYGAACFHPLLESFAPCGVFLHFVQGCQHRRLKLSSVKPSSIWPQAILKIPPVKCASKCLSVQCKIDISRVRSALTEQNTPKAPLVFYPTHDAIDMALRGESGWQAVHCKAFGKDVYAAHMYRD